MEPLSLLTLLGCVSACYFIHAIAFIILDYLKIADIHLDDDE